MSKTDGNGVANPHRQNSSGAAAGASSGIFVFEADTAAFANRKRAARACASCQKRKKRCPHTFTKGADDDQNGSGAEKVLPHLTHKEPIRFVGDLNPESIMTDLSTREKGQKRFSHVGTWVEQNQLRNDSNQQDAGTRPSVPQNATLPPAPAGEAPGTGSRHAQRCAVEKYSKIERGRRTLTGHQKNYLQAVGAFRVLPKITQDALVTTYIACMDPLLPVIDGTKFLRDYTSGEASVFLVQAVCMVACKTEEAAPYLRLYEDGPLLDPIPFARSLHTGLDAAMKADLEADRFTKVQIMTLMSLHNDGPGGIEESSLHLAQAIHDAQTTGMHIDTPGRTRNDQGAQLWWTLWMLDKYNACLGGRPLMIAERDIDIKEPNWAAAPRSQALAMWMQLGHLLDKVIEFYRPITDPDETGWETDFPSWTELRSKCDLDALLPTHQNALEICYNIIGILACRSGGSTTMSYNRRIACADRIQSLISTQKDSNLPPLPLIPYAASLCLTVAYRGLRDHHTDLTRVVSDLTTRCEILERLSSSWWTADAMAKLGRKALKSLQQMEANQGKTATIPAEITNEIEAEVHVCKYSLLNNEKKAEDAKKQQSPRQDNTSGNALRMLSDAAATHGRPGGKQSKAVPSQAELNNDSDIHAKRRRMDQSRHSSITASNNPSPHNTAGSTVETNSSSNTPQLVHASTIHTPSSIDHSHHLTNSPGLMTPNTLTSGPSVDTPGGLSSNANNHSSGSNSADMDPFNSFGNTYADLDNLFDGFFDLSLPTYFQDPLFDGAAYFSMDMDTGMDQNHSLGIGAGSDAFGFMDGPVNVGGIGAMGMGGVGGGSSKYNASMGALNVMADMSGVNVGGGYGGMRGARG